MRSSDVSSSEVSTLLLFERNLLHGLGPNLNLIYIIVSKPSKIATYKIVDSKELGTLVLFRVRYNYLFKCKLLQFHLMFSKAVR